MLSDQKQELKGLLKQAACFLEKKLKKKRKSRDKNVAKKLEEVFYLIATSQMPMVTGQKQPHHELTEFRSFASPNT